MTTVARHLRRMPPSPISVFIAGLDALAAAVGELPPADIDSAKRYGAARRRLQFLGGRALLRLALAAHGGRPWGDVELTVIDGRPHAPGMPDLKLSLSHTGTSIACALSEPCACGLDLQHKVDKPMLEIAEAFFTPGEHEQLANIQAGDRENRFYDWWTLKEAWAKASGADLLHALSRVRVTRPGEAQTRDWLAWSFEPEPGIAGALVVSATEAGTAVEPTLALWRGDSFVTADFACRPVALAIRDA